MGLGLEVLMKAHSREVSQQPHLLLILCDDVALILDGGSNQPFLAKNGVKWGPGKVGLEGILM